MHKAEEETINKELKKERSSLEIINKKCAALQKEVVRHEEINKKLINQTAEKGGDSATTNVGETSNKLETKAKSEKGNKGLIKAEVKSLKMRTATLENIKRDKEHHISGIELELEAAKLESKREKQINDVFIKFGLQPNLELHNALPSNINIIC